MRIIDYDKGCITENQYIFMLKNCHVIIFHVEIFMYTSRPFESFMRTYVYTHHTIICTKWHNYCGMRRLTAEVSSGLALVYL